MNTLGLVKAVAKAAQSDRVEVDINTKVLISVMRQTLRAGESVTLGRFGRFDPVFSEEKLVDVTFVPSAVLLR